MVRRALLLLVVVTLATTPSAAADPPAPPVLIPALGPLLPTTPASTPFPTGCVLPSLALSDPLATWETRCVYAAIEGFGQGRGDLPVGQQLLTSELGGRRPVSTLQAERYSGVPAATPAVIGSDLGAMQVYLDQGDPASLRILGSHVDGLIADGRAGRLVTLSWHAHSPFSGGGFRDRTGADLRLLLDATTPAAQAWARQTDQVIGVLRRFQDAGVPVAFRPLHEVNLTAFWWGQPDPTAYRAVWDQLRSRVEAAGIHNVIWVYAPNHRHSASVTDPFAYTPARYDVFGIDTYDWEPSDPTDRVNLDAATYDRIVALGKPFALTEVGPMNSADGRWNPATLTTAVSQRYPRTAWALFWATYSQASRSAIVDLVGHQAWWATCDHGTCRTTRPA